MWSKPPRSFFSNILLVLRATPKLLPCRRFNQNIITLTLNYEEYHEKFSCVISLSLLLNKTPAKIIEPETGASTKIRVFWDIYKIHSRRQRVTLQKTQLSTELLLQISGLLWLNCIEILKHHFVQHKPNLGKGNGGK
jgi:hypothetical protein